MNDDLWQALPYEAWKDTYDTLHMWSQMVGKVALALAPPENHGWGIALHLTERGMATRLLPYGERSFSLELAFMELWLVIAATDGVVRTLKLEPRTVADFYRDFVATLAEMGLGVRIWPVPVEFADPIPFAKDTKHHSYDPDYAHRFWRILVQVEQVFAGARCTFVGKCSPVHFFWGGFDLAVTRLFRRLAPPRGGPAVIREADSHERISHGFWPGSAPLFQTSFYAYPVPEPAGPQNAPLETSSPA